MRIDGPKIRRIRSHLCLSQLELAIEANVSRRTVQKAEKSESDLSVKTLERIAEALDVDYEELLVKTEGENH